MGQWDVKKYTVEDFAAGFIRFANGATVLIEASFAANIEDDQFDAWLLGTKGGADVFKPEIYTEDAGSLWDVTPYGLPTPRIKHPAHCREIELFVEAVRKNKPVPVPGEEPGPDGVDPRLARCRSHFELQDGLLPHLRAMHWMTPEHVHEEIELQAPDFSSYILEWIAHAPRWRDYYLAHDQRPHYAYMKKALKALQWQRGPDRWILKSPQHLAPDLVAPSPGDRGQSPVHVATRHVILWLG